MCVFVEMPVVNRRPFPEIHIPKTKHMDSKEWHKRYKQEYRPRIQHAPCVYLATAANGLVKIGYTRSIEDRRHVFDSISPIEIKVLFAMATDSNHNAHALERQLHRRFKHRHDHGEWYALTKADIANIRKLIGQEVKL